MMRKTWLVLKTEIINVFTRRSFLIMTFGVPIIGFLLFMGVSKLNESNPETLESIIFDPSPDQEAEGYVDYSGVIETIPSEIPPGRLVSYLNEEEAMQALESEEISAFYIIPQDTVESGEVIYVKPDLTPFSNEGEDWFIYWAFDVNLLGGDENLTGLVKNPIVVDRVPLRPEAVREEENLLTFIVPYATTILFYIIILAAASMLLNSVATEKQNQVIEVLMLSMTPRQLLTGKIVGLGITGLLQTIIYTGISYSLLVLSGRTSTMAASFDLPPSILGWGLVFFLSGYAIYASLMAGLGALVPNVREASQASFTVISPMLLPMFFMAALIQEPNGPISVGLSLFPLTAPISMMTRMTAGTVPLWQPILSIGLMILTAALIIRSVAGLYRAQVLLSGQEFKTSLFFRALLGRV
jgi:ABC-2 type transport system permease protein